MAYITQLISGDQQLQMGNEELLWKMGFGTSWRAVRIGMRYTVNMAVNTAVANASIGLNSGTTYGLKSNATPEWIGFNLGASNVPYGYTYVAGSPAYWSAQFWSYMYQVGSTPVYSRATAGTTVTIYGPVYPTRGMVFVDIYKSASLLSVCGNVSSTAASAQVDYSLDTFYRIMEQDTGTPSSIPFVYTTGGSTFKTFAYYGPSSFDSVSVSWISYATPLLISDLMVVKYS